MTRSARGDQQFHRADSSGGMDDLQWPLSLGRRHHIHAGGPVRVVAEIGYRAGRVDPANSYPTIKALTDGMTHHLDLIRHVWIGRHMQLAAVCACGWESSPQRDRRRAQATYERHTRKATTS